MDTWVLVERYERNADAAKLLKLAKSGLEERICHVTVAELVNVISHVFGEREALVQYAFLRHSGLVLNGTSEEIARDAGLFKTKYRFSLADAFVLASAIACDADVLVTGGDAQYDREWKQVDEIKVVKLDDFVETV